MLRESEYLSKRFQQIMDLAYQKGQITASELEASLPGQPSNSTVRTQLRALEERGLLRHIEEEGKYVYLPTRPRPNAAKAAMQRFLRTFVDNSAETALATLLSAKEADLTEADFRRLESIIEEAKNRSKKNA